MNPSLHGMLPVGWASDDRASTVRHALVLNQASLPPRRHEAMSGNICPCRNWVGWGTVPLASGSVEARDVSQHPAMRGTAPTMENDLNRNVSSVKAEKPRSSVVIALFKAGPRF